jgi:Rps23 Pro-64 3,4-dihydroxylase Tpa1-like proline 4-hydroxylase
MATCYDKGSYLDAHDDLGRGRAVAYALELTPRPWARELGGHLEEIDPDTGAVIAHHAPAWNALVLHGVATGRPSRRIPIVRDHVDRRALRGWYYPAPPDPNARAGVRPANGR